MSRNVIEHLVDFDKLYLVWQAPQDPHRLRYTVAVLIRTAFGVEFRYLKSSEDYQRAIKLGFTGYPAFNTDKEIHTVGVLDAFTRRLPPNTRGDFKQYLEILRLPTEPSEFSLLGYAGAKLPGDSFTIIPSFEKVTNAFEFLMDVAGFRHEVEMDLEKINLGTAVTFVEEPENIIDPDAIRICIENMKIGYVTRALLPAFHEWMKTGRQIDAVIERKNGQPDSPVLYLFVRVVAQVVRRNVQSS